MPVQVRARQTRDLQSKHRAHLPHRDICHQCLEVLASLHPCTRLTQIPIQRADGRLWPAQCQRFVPQRVLAFGTLLMTAPQVRRHPERTGRQYALRDKALALGWPETAIRTLDRDLGQSGARMKGREDFKTLVADVSMGQVGAVFALEGSRLARSNLDWHRLLELCALTHTLVIDADGCYDPGDFNDGLLL